MTNKQAYAGLLERLREQANHFRRTSPALTDEHWLMLGDEAAEAISSLLKRVGELEAAAKPFADSVVIDPTKKRGDRHWATFGKPTNIDDIINLRAALNSDAPLSIGEEQ